MRNPTHQRRVLGVYQDVNEKKIKRLVYYTDSGQWFDALARKEINPPNEWFVFDPYASMIESEKESELMIESEKESELMIED